MARGVISAAMCKQRLRLSDEDYRPFRKQCATIARELGIKFKRMCPPETWEVYTRRAMESEYLDAVRPTLGDGKRTSANKAAFDALDWILINVLLSAQVEAKRKGEPGGYGSRRSSAVGVDGGMHRADSESSPHAEKRPRLLQEGTTSPDSHHPAHLPSHPHAQVQSFHHLQPHHGEPNTEAHMQLLNENLKLLNDSFPDTVPPLARLQLQQLYLQIADAIQTGETDVKDVLEAVVRFGVMAMGATVAAQE